MRAVVDLEANGFLRAATRVWCGVAKDLDSGKVFKFRPHQMDELCQFLSQCRVIIGHNWLDYDEPLLKKLLKFTSEAQVIDTYILSQMVEPDRRKHPRCPNNKGAHSLANFGCIFRRYKPDHEDWSQFSEDMLHRCTEDVEINLMAFNMLNRKADIFNPKSIWRKPYLLEAAFQRCLVKQKLHGVLVDKAKIEGHIEYLTKRIDRLDSQLVPKLPKQLIIKEGKDKDGSRKWVKKPFNGDGSINKHVLNWLAASGYTDSSILAGPFSRILIEDFDLGSRNQTVEYLLSQGWKPATWNTKEDPVTKEKRRTSPKLNKDDPFLGIRGALGKRVSLRMIYRHRRSQLEGWLKIIRDDGRITADSTGITPTCRLKHKGVVNVPNPDSGSLFAKQMREPFVVPEGYVMIGCDAASCQLRNLCHHMGDERYTDAVLNGNKEEGTDIHSLNMAETGIQHRSKAKNFIYGFLFGAGDEKIGAILEQDKRAGKKMKETFFARFPKLKQLIDRLEGQLRTKKCIIGLDGREVYPRSNHELLCYLLQSDEAILMKAATVYAHNWIAEKGLDAHMVIHMHDEYQWEVKKEHAEQVAELLEKAIVKAGEFFKMNVPMAGEAEIGLNWGDTH